MRRASSGRPADNHWRAVCNCCAADCAGISWAGCGGGMVLLGSRDGMGWFGTECVGCRAGRGAGFVAAGGGGRADAICSSALCSAINAASAWRCCLSLSISCRNTSASPRASSSSCARWVSSCVLRASSCFLRCIAVAADQQSRSADRQPDVRVRHAPPAARQRLILGSFGRRAAWAPPVSCAINVWSSLSSPCKSATTSLNASSDDCRRCCSATSEGGTLCS